MSLDRVEKTLSLIASAIAIIAAVIGVLFWIAGPDKVQSSPTLVQDRSAHEQHVEFKEKEKRIEAMPLDQVGGLPSSPGWFRLQVLLILGCSVGTVFTYIFRKQVGHDAQQPMLGISVGMAIFFMVPGALVTVYEVVQWVITGLTNSSAYYLRAGLVALTAITFAVAGCLADRR
jgi:hypothetical protein